MKVGQNRPSVPTKSTATTEARKGTTAAPAQAPTARGASTFQTGFDTTVRKNTFSVEAAATPRVMTPPVPADVPTEGARLGDDQLRKLLDEAHQLIFGNKANGANVEAWMDKARTMRNEGKDANTIKYALFDMLRGAPSASQMARPDDKLLRTLLDEAHKLVFGNEANGPNVNAWMDKARALRSDTTKNLDANGIKYALFDLMRQAK